MACVVLALVGLVPVVAALVVRLPWARERVTALVRRELRGAFGLEASFGLRVDLVPPTLVLQGVEVASTDGQGPAVTVARVRVVPRLFTLLAGRIDIGDIELLEPHVRLTIEGGQPTNLGLRLPATKEPSEPLDLRHLPLRTLSVEQAQVALQLVDAGVSLQVDDLDLDLGVRGPELELGLQLGQARVHRRRARAAEGGGSPAFDDDVLCGLRARVHYDGGQELLVRRLDLDARLDDDDEPGLGPRCEAAAAEGAEVSLGLERVQVLAGPGMLPGSGEPAPPGAPALLPRVSGRVRVEAPLRLLGRFVPTAPSLTGQVGVDAEVKFDGKLDALPEVAGTVRARDVVLGGQRTIAQRLEARVEAGGREARIPLAHARYGDGEVTLRGVVAHPFEEGIPLEVAAVAIRGLSFPGLMRDVGITRHTIVDWTLDGDITDFKGKAFDPAKGGPSLLGDVAVDSRDFELGDRGWDDPRRRRVVSTKRAKIRGKFGVEPTSVVFKQLLAEFGNSRIDVASVTIGTSTDVIDVRLGDRTVFDLGEISPLLTLPVGGRIEVRGGVCCLRSAPKVEGELRVTDLSMAGLPLADSAAMHAVFRPFVLELSEGGAQKGKSSYQVPRLRVDFDRPAGLKAEGNITTTDMDLRDLLAVVEFDKDPRYTEIAGHTSGQVHLTFEIGGANDPCDSGVITAESRLQMKALDLYGEHYDGGDGEIDLTWFDREAAERGMDAEIRSLSLRKGRGVISGAGTMRRGARLGGHFVATDVPLNRIQAMEPLGRLVDGSASASGTIGGTVEAPEVQGQVRVSPVRVGQKTLPASSLALLLTPAPPARDEHPRLTRRCHEPIPRAFDPQSLALDRVKGVYRVDGDMFGGQLRLDDVRTTWQHAKLVTGNVTARKLDLGALLQLVPAMAMTERPPTGELSGSARLDHIELDHLERSEAELRVEQFEVRQGPSRLRLKLPVGTTSAGMQVARDTLTIDRTGFEVVTGAGVGTEIELGGRVSELTTTKKLDLQARLAPIEIGPLLEGMPRVEAAAGRLEGSVSVQGTAETPLTRGELRLRQGSIALSGAPVSLDEIEVLARVDEQEVRIVQGLARAGGGQVQLTARAPLRGFALGELSAQIEARGVRLALADGVEMVADASLGATAPAGIVGPNRRARLGGAVTVQSFRYTRPISVAFDLDSLARRGRRTEVNVYDPADDVVDLAVSVSAPRPLVFRNNLIEADLAVESALLLRGTNQRVGLQGLLRVNPGGRMRLPGIGNEFDIRQGTIRFDDPVRIAPRVDLQASTEYRRVTTSASTSAASVGGGAASGAGTQGAASAGGFWRILLHAYNDVESVKNSDVDDSLKIDLSSEPGLAREDIVLLLTAGMTRAELDQLQASNIGSAVALEALSALSGADRAVKTVLPIIDDFRFGSAYSPRTGRTEPTLTVGKRISDRLRANVITGLTDNRDVRSNVEWRFGNGTSILGNYDNLSDVASRGLGNVGADFRVRLEF